MSDFLSGNYDEKENQIFESTIPEKEKLTLKDFYTPSNLYDTSHFLQNNYLFMIN